MIGYAVVHRSVEQFILSVAIVGVFFTGSYPCVGSDTLDGLNACKTEQACGSYLQTLTYEQLLALCNQYGLMVDSGKEQEEGGPILFAMILAAAKTKGSITIDYLRQIARNKDMSVTWRRAAFEFSAGDLPSIVPFSEEEILKTIKFCLEVLQDASDVDKIRMVATWRAEKALRDAYKRSWKKLNDHGLQKEEKSWLILRRAESDATEWRILDETLARFVRICTRGLNDPTVSPALKTMGFARFLSATVFWRGAKTPELGQVRKAFQDLLASKEIANWSEKDREEMQSCVTGIDKTLTETSE